MSELSWICNPAPLNIRIYNPKYTVLTFLPHHRCSYSMVSDCKSDTTESYGSLRLKCYLECVFKIRSIDYCYKCHYKYEF